MDFLLDTNICIALIKRSPASAIRRLMELKPGSVAISIVAVAELRYGIAKSKAKEQNNLALDEFLFPLEILDFDEASANAYGIIRFNLESAGTPIGPLDTMIAAQAIAHDLVLVTNNQREFSRIKMLKLDNWLLDTV